MRNLPFGFTIVTMLFTQSVGLWTLSMTFSLSIRSSSSFTFEQRVTGTCEGGVNYWFVVGVNFDVVCHSCDTI